MLVFSRQGEMLIQPVRLTGHGRQARPKVAAAASRRRAPLKSPRIDIQAKAAGVDGGKSAFEIKAAALHNRAFAINLVTVPSDGPLPVDRGLSRVKALPQLALPSDKETLLPAEEQPRDDTDGDDEERHLCLLDEALDSRLSPLQLTLPDSPVLKAVWLRSVASYERLRLRQAAKRLRLAHGRQVRGLVPISESP